MAKKIQVGNALLNPSETVVKFGLGQVGKTTPIWAKNLFRIVLYGAMTLTLVTQIVTEIPVEISTAIAKYSIEAVALVHAITKLWGVDIKED